MGKKSKNLNKINNNNNNKKRSGNNEKPFVSVCTPTFNRRPFIPIMFEIFKNQDYPKDRMEWIIVDDGTDPIEDLVKESGIPQIRYFRLETKMSLGKKRNYMHSLVSPQCEYIIYHDDDDWYPHNRISHSIEMLENHPKALIAASSEIYVYFKHIQKLYQFGPYGPNHGTAGTFCLRKRLIEISSYDETAELAEEKHFLKEYTIPMVQLDPMKTILVFSHNHNTFDKRILLESPNVAFCKESDKTIDMFFKQNTEIETRIKRFFTEEIESELQKYEPGEPKNKPNVLKQIAEIKEKREKMVQQQMQQNGGIPPGIPQIMINQPGQPPMALTLDNVVGLLNTQQKHIEYLMSQNEELEQKCNLLQSKVVELCKSK